MTAAEASSRSVMLGKYRVIARLGTGGMAEVFLAVAQGAMNVNRLVVVKRLRDELANDPASREMFLDEARLAARLNHPNVIQTFEAGSEGGSWFLAMEYVEGQPFSRVLSKLKKEERALAPKMAARIVADSLNGLHYAHELTDFDGTPLTIVHRDVSPQNMMITYGGVSKIVDFGIAKAAGSTETAHGVFKGKVAFMAPEQVLGEAIDARADLFAAGIVLWEALAGGGTHLFSAETPARTLYNLMNKEIPHIAEINPDIPAALDTIVARALQRDVEKRYPTAKAMRDALEDYIAATGGLTSEAVGELVTDLFADRRESVQAQVKAQLAALSFGRASEPDLSVVSKTHVKPAPVIDLSEAAVEGDSTPAVFRVVTATEGAVTADVAPPPPLPPRTSRAAITVLLAVTTLALVVSGLALHRAQATPVAIAPTVVTVTVPAAPAPSPPPPPPPPTVDTPPPPSVAPAPSPPPPPPPPAAPAAPKSLLVARPASPRPTPADEPPRASPAPAPQPAPAPAETARGRTFRRDL